MGQLTTTEGPLMSDVPTLGDREALVDAVIGHQRIPLFDGSGGSRCSGCDHLRGETDGPNSPRHVRHQIDVLLAALPSPAEYVRGLADDEAMRAVAQDAVHRWCGASHLYAGLGSYILAAVAAGTADIDVLTERTDR